MFAPPVSEFELTMLEGVPATAVGPGPAVVLCLAGRAEVFEGATCTTLAQGEAVLATGPDVRVRAPGTVVVGRCPLAR